MRAHVLSRAVSGSEIDPVRLQIASHLPTVDLSNFLGTYSSVSVGAALVLAAWQEAAALVWRGRDRFAASMVEGSARPSRWSQPG
jgi:hypothetical protein